MTEAGEKWARDKYADHPTFTSTDSIYDQSEFWLRAFCDEVEKRLRNKGFYEDFHEVFEKLERELLGEK